MKKIAFALMMVPGAALAHESGAAHDHSLEIALLVIAIGVSTGAALRSWSRANAAKEMIRAVEKRPSA